MTSEQPPPRRSPRAADPYAKRFRELKTELAQIGYFSKGTVLTRRMKCGKPQCACHTQPAKRHGPYYEWTYKEQGKTVNVRLSKQAAPIYQRAAQQYRKLKAILNRLEKLSRQALARSAKDATRHPPE
jgi:uncharacterized coiled-coil protein SlyX